MLIIWGKKEKDDAGARPRERQTGRKDLAATIRMGAWAGWAYKMGNTGKKQRELLVSRLNVLGVIAPIRMHVERIPIRNCY